MAVPPSAGPALSTPPLPPGYWVLLPAPLPHPLLHPPVTGSCYYILVYFFIFQQLIVYSEYNNDK